VGLTSHPVKSGDVVLLYGTGFGPAHPLLRDGVSTVQRSRLWACFLPRFRFVRRKKRHPTGWKHCGSSIVSASMRTLDQVHQALSVYP
jgi:hypothetical protein